MLPCLTNVLPCCHSFEILEGSSRHKIEELGSVISRFLSPDPIDLHSNSRATTSIGTSIPLHSLIFPSENRGLGHLESLGFETLHGVMECAGRKSDLGFLPSSTSHQPLV